MLLTNPSHALYLIGMLYKLQEANRKRKADAKAQEQLQCRQDVADGAGPDPLRGGMLDENGCPYSQHTFSGLALHRCCCMSIHLCIRLLEAGDCGDPVAVAVGVRCSALYNCQYLRLIAYSDSMIEDLSSHKTVAQMHSCSNLYECVCNSCDIHGTLCVSHSPVWGDSCDICPMLCRRRSRSYKDEAAGSQGVHARLQDCQLHLPVRAIQGMQGSMRNLERSLPAVHRA